MYRTNIRASKKNKSSGGPARRALIRLGVCACLLAAAAAVKNAGGGAAEELYFRITRDVDYTQAFRTAGTALAQGGVAQAVSGFCGDVFVTEESRAGEKSRAELREYYEKSQRDFAGLEEPVNVDEGYVELGLEWVPPARGTVTDGFGYRVHPVTGETAFHYGADIAAAEGDPVLAFAAGEVTAVGQSSTDGLFIKVAHPGGAVSYYAHCSQALAEKGDSVEPGQQIALMGSTGNATGACLHFELRLGEVYINPMYYLGELL